MAGSRVLGVVLAGGASSRFGSDKALAVIGGVTLLDHACAALRAVTDEVVVIGRAGGAPDRPVPGLGPLGGIAGALGYAAERGFDSVLTIGCDMPVVPVRLLEALLTRSPSYCGDAPVLGHWPVSAAAGLAARLALHAPSPRHDGGGQRSASLSVRRWAEAIGAVVISSPVTLANINTPADLPAS